MLFALVCNKFFLLFKQCHADWKRTEDRSCCGGNWQGSRYVDRFCGTVWLCLVILQWNVSFNVSKESRWKSGTKRLATRQRRHEVNSEQFEEFVTRLTGKRNRANGIRQIYYQNNLCPGLKSCAGFAILFGTTESFFQSTGRHTSCVRWERPLPPPPPPEKMYFVVLSKMYFVVFLRPRELAIDLLELS